MSFHTEQPCSIAYDVKYGDRTIRIYARFFVFPVIMCLWSTSCKIGPKTWAPRYSLNLMFTARSVSINKRNHRQQCVCPRRGAALGWNSAALLQQLKSSLSPSSSLRSVSSAATERRSYASRCAGVELTPRPACVLHAFVGSRAQLICIWTQHPSWIVTFYILL